jgi:hypothetical protein
MNMNDDLDYFKSNYSEARRSFRHSLDDISKRWPAARLTSQPIGHPDAQDLTIDWIHAPANDSKQRLLIISMGEHGVEGFIGSAVLTIFTKEYLPLLNPDDTGIILIHAINPWGMQHLRRVNAQNIDLNRNFLWDPNFFTTKGQDFNAEYTRIFTYLNPGRKLQGGPAFFFSKFAFFIQTLWNLLIFGQRTTYTAVLLGQYRFPRGIYYGGDAWASETRLMMDLYRQRIAEYEQIVHLDMHSGYGPRYQMSIVNSYLEPQSSAEMQENFAYPLVVKSNPAEFYSMQGDMIDFLYTLVQNEFPHKRYYGTSFEFGTFGDTIPARLHSLQTMILENQCYHYGSSNAGIRRRIQQDFLELYYPSAPEWRNKALADARQAFKGILKAYHYI